MSERLYKANKQKIAAKADAGEQSRKIVLVGTCADVFAAERDAHPETLV